MVHGGIHHHEEEEKAKQQLHERRERLDRLVTAFFPITPLGQADPILWRADEGAFVVEKRFKDGLGIANGHPDSQRQEQGQVWDFLPP